MRVYLVGHLVLDDGATVEHFHGHALSSFRVLSEFHLRKSSLPNRPPNLVLPHFPQHHLSLTAPISASALHTLPTPKAFHESNVNHKLRTFPTFNLLFISLLSSLNLKYWKKPTSLFEINQKENRNRKSVWQLWRKVHWLVGHKKGEIWDFSQTEIGVKKIRVWKEKMKEGKLKRKGKKFEFFIIVYWDILETEKAWWSCDEAVSKQEGGRCWLCVVRTMENERIDGWRSFGEQFP